MSQIKVIPCPIEGLYVIEPSIHNDKRGLFFESYNAKEMEAYGLRREFVQDNESYSVKGVLRGLHFQKEHSQCKICRVIDGAVFDVAVYFLHMSGSRINARISGIPKTREALPGTIRTLGSSGRRFPGSTGELPQGKATRWTAFRWC